MKCCFINCKNESTEQVKTYWNLNGEPVCSDHRESILKNIFIQGKRISKKLSKKFAENEANV